MIIELNIIPSAFQPNFVTLSLDGIDIHYNFTIEDEATLIPAIAAAITALEAEDPTNLGYLFEKETIYSAVKINVYSDTLASPSELVCDKGVFIDEIHPAFATVDDAITQILAKV